MNRSEAVRDGGTVNSIYRTFAYTEVDRSVDKTEMSFPNFSVDIKLQKTWVMKIKCDKGTNFQAHNSITC